MTRAVYILAGAALVAAPFLWSQTKAPSASKTKQKQGPAPPPAPTVFPLETLRIEGNRQIPAAKVIAASGLKIGANTVKKDFDDARDRLTATGAFESVGYEYKPSASATGYDAVIQVIEAPQLFPYHFEDIPVADNVLRTALQKLEPIFDDKIPPSTAMIDRYAKALTQIAGITVVGKVGGDRGGAEILFRPNTSRPNIAEVHFTGNDALPSPLLMRSLSAVAVGVPYSETSFRQILEASLRPLYEARGRLRVEFPTVTTAKAERVDGLVVTTSIREGEVYHLGSVRWEGVAQSLQDQVDKAANFKKNDIANFDDIQDGLKRVNQRYLSGGFLKQTSKVERDLRDQDHVVNLTIKVDPGPQFVMGKLTINGLDILSEPVIRKMWRLDQGKPFQSGYPDSFLARVREEDLFDNLGKTTADSNVNETSHVVDVTLTFGGARGQKEKGKQLPKPVEAPDPPPFFR